MKRRIRELGSRALSRLHKPVGKWNLQRELARAESPLRIELGAWTTTRLGWISTDVHWRGRCYLDGTRTWPVPSNSASCIFADNVIEHVDLQANRTLFREALRVLQPGGVLRLVTPDIAALVNLYEAGPDTAGPLRDELVDEGYLIAHQVDVLRFAFQDDGHHVGYLWDQASLTSELADAGFINIHPCRPGESSTQHLTGLELRIDTPVAAIMLNIEASKPQG